MNIHYIRAAIRENTGVTLKLEEIRDLLVEEGLITPTKAKHCIFRGYSEFYEYFYNQDKNLVIPTIERTTPLDVVEQLHEQDVK